MLFGRRAEVAVFHTLPILAIVKVGHVSAPVVDWLCCRDGCKLV